MDMPWVKYFWKAMNTATIGIAASVAPAMMRPKSLDISPYICAIPTEIVSFSLLVSMISWRK